MNYWTSALADKWNGNELSALWFQKVSKSLVEFAHMVAIVPLVYTGTAPPPAAALARPTLPAAGS